MGEHELVEDGIVEAQADPRRPYKMYVAMIVAAGWAFLGNEVVQDKPWVMAIVGAVLAGLAVYIVPNPIKAKFRS